MTLFNLSTHQRDRILKTIKGNIEKLIIKTNYSEIERAKSFVQTFAIGNAKIEITTTEPIDAKEGDFVIVAGEQSFNEIFKAYSFKNLN